MSLNGGLGDVVAAQKNLMLDTAMSERMMVTKGIGCSYWLVTHRNNSSAYRVFKIDVNGIDPVPVVSNGLWPGDIGGGQLKISPDGTKLVTVSTLQGAGIELADFDKTTGMVSNFVMLGGGGLTSYYGSCFSPDNSKLYITQFAGYLFQYDLSLLPNTATMEASKYIYPQPLQYSGMRNAPDGKIYVAIFQNTPFIGCINDPNGLGAACNFDPNALAQPSYAPFTTLAGNPYGHGLGDDVVIVSGGDTVAHKTTDTLTCAADGLILNASDSFSSYLWNDGSSGSSKTVNQGGTYWVYMMDDCAVFTDTFHVTMGGFTVNLGSDTFICPGGSLVLDPQLAGGSYLWQDGSTEATFTVGEAGIYSVQVSLNGCTNGDTISINVYNPSVDILENDTTLCEGDNIILHAKAVPSGILNWSNGSTGDECVAGQAGSYTVTTSNDCGTFRDSVYITQMNCNCQAFIPNAFSPNGDLLNDVFRVDIPCAYSDFLIQIFDRWGNRVFSGLSTEAVWDGLQNGRPCDVGTYFYYLRYQGVRGERFEKKGDLALIR
jgi:gliding motility-associated-like protein